MGSGKTRLVRSVPFFLPQQLIDGGLHRRSPGRYFAAVELKAMLAHVLVTYDVKLAKEGVRPPDTWLASVCLPSRTAKVSFRKRLD